MADYQPMTLEQRIAALQAENGKLIDSNNALTQTVIGKMGEINHALSDAQAQVESKKQELEQRVNSYLSGAREELGFTALNYNHDFLDTYTTANGEIELPVGIGTHSNNPITEYFDIEMIPVRSGDVDGRSDVAKELLTAMNIGANTLHFSSSFKILHIKHKENMPIPSKWVFHIPNQHIKHMQGASLILWAKGKGFNWGMDTNLEWKQVRRAWRPSANPGPYVHVDVYMHEAGGELYLALPSIVAGVWPEDRVLGNLYNPKSELIRRGAAWHDVTAHDAWRDTNTANGGDPARDTV
ncbi:hypothetical protein [Pseudoalteromonas piscicida]|uniref:Uncharacterized protein n=1 Tax=Pseudoalteromonas piscicida TaxID=43662 RepID=A0AAD0W3K1_PSEO7|nr:hypothetical protein [Pseudoalteromonas piscicida]ASD67655.1 hypothetical protein B1L02_11945 [Pseudoalteromonas piscicida]AXR01641.1 hypothetical protein D0511_05790 [Pseudoalteromonas piscicida]